MKEITVSGTNNRPGNFTGKVYWKEHKHYDGDIDYWLDGSLHRIDGPALIRIKPGHEKRFFIKGQEFDSKEQWFAALSEDEKIQALWNIDDWG